jgi:nucleotide-binding universal stress UspA family protein
MLELNRILCATDFSEPSDRAIEYASAVARRFEAELLLVNVLDSMPPIISPHVGSAVTTVSPVVDQQSILEYQKSQLESSAKKLDQLSEQIKRPGVKVRKRVLEGKPSDEIVALAHAEDVDLIVIATHGQSGWRRFLFGSVADKVIRSAECPVLSVAPKEQS